METARRYKKELPEKYYLDHFAEFIGFINGPCHALLDKQDQAFIQAYQALEEDARCLVVRAANRKSPFIRKDSLYYAELSHVDSHLQTLANAGLFRPLNTTDLFHFWTCLNKDELCQVMEQRNLSYRKSARKDLLVEQAQAQLDTLSPDELGCHDEYLVRNFDNNLDYFLFLFFGNLSSGLNKFSMRDLGVMRTRKGEAAYVARFDTLQQGKTAYHYARLLRDVSALSPEQAFADAGNVIALPAPEGNMAKRYRDRYLHKLGLAVSKQDMPLALKTWQSSDHPDAQEKWVRETYKIGDKASVEQRLQQIIDSPESEHLLLFAEDFLARKFASKRTSILTDMLRASSRRLAIDEMHRDYVERGVMDYYERHQKQAFHCENQLWRALFGLSFWHIIYHQDEAALATEFDYRPRSLREGILYQEFADEIENTLTRIIDPANFREHITQACVRQYGKLNNLFHWHPDLLSLLHTLIKHAPVDALQSMLRAMAKEFAVYSDGFPDLMVIDNDRLRFEEIKSPGDQLRKNQLLTIRRMRECGFDVDITQVEWIVDPDQPYVVVDVETTGGSADYDRITEIGMVKVIAGDVVDSWQSLINPQRHIPARITQLTGIDNAMVTDAPLFAEVVDTLDAFMDGCVFVAHNVNFDYGFFKREYARLERRFSMPKLCTVREMRKAVPGLQSYSLANLAAHFEIDMAQHHRAASDAFAAAELLNIVNQQRLKQQNGK